MSDEDEPIDLEKVREADELLDEAEKIREETGRAARSISDDELRAIMDEDKQTYTVSEVAQLTGYHPESIRRHIRDGKLKAAQTGRGNYRVSRPEIARWWRDELGGGELFDDPRADAQGKELIAKLQAERETAGADWRPPRDQVAKLAEMCALATWRHYREHAWLEWDNDAPKPDDWDAFQQAFDEKVEKDDALADHFIEAYEQAIEMIRASDATDSEG